ncbi:hypothetical protein V9L05_20540 [Bernardetia sp. Wsw4-3y2]|uniref:hypothetical protein n=1 Tax=Bernardetia sp. Wsw4-3y2 TaxID=3127471 RepID=UPI0030D5E746
MPFIIGFTPYGCSPTDVYALGDDCLDQPGKIAYIVLISIDFIGFTDITDQAEWATAITAGTIEIIPTAGELPPPSPVLQPAKGRQKDRIVGFDSSATVRADNPDGNHKWMQKLNFQRNKFGVGFVTPDLAIHVPITKKGDVLPLSTMAYPIIPAEIASQREIEIVMNWSTKQAMLSEADLPESVFD